MHSKLLHKSFMEPVVVLVPPAHATPTTGRDHAVSRELLDSLELLLLLWVCHLDGERGGVWVPHGCVCRDEKKHVL